MTRVTGDDEGGPLGTQTTLRAPVRTWVDALQDKVMEIDNELEERSAGMDRGIALYAIDAARMSCGMLRTWLGVLARELAEQEP